MKTLLIGFLALGSVSAFASDISIGGYGSNKKSIVTISGKEGLELFNLLDVKEDNEGTKRGKSITCFKSGICVFDILSNGKIKPTNH